MVKIENFAWIVVVIGAILALIGFFVPAAEMEFFGITTYMWKYGYMHSSGWGSSSSGFLEFEGDITDQMLQMIGVIAVSIILTLAGIILIFFTSYKAIRDKKPMGKIWIVLGIMLLVSELVFIIGLGSINLGSSYYEIYFWDMFQVSSGPILAIVGGAIAIVGGLLGEFGDRLS